MNSSPVFDASGLLEMLLSLALVVGLIVGLSWVVGRLRGVSRGGAGPLGVAAELVVGPKERVMLVRVGDRQTLIGVSSAGITPLQLLDQTIVVPDAPALSAGGFAQRLREAMNRSGSAK